jgi:hypothetical protein
LLIVGSVHTILIWFVFLPQASEDRDFRKSQILVRTFPRRRFLLAVIVSPAGS